MKGLMTTVTNAANGKSYFVSTVKCPRTEELHQTAVFRQIFGPFANFWRPQAFFLGSDAAFLHARVAELVRDVDPAGWNDKDIFAFSAEGDGVFAALELERRLRAIE
jgi:hypothetical protein